LVSLTPGAPELVLAASPFVRVPYLIDADMHGRAYGVEATSTWRVRRGWTLTGGYTFLALALSSIETGDLRYETTENHSPRHQVSLRSLASFGSRWEADAAMQVVGGIDAGTVPGYVRVDLRAGYRVSDHVKISLAGLNLLDSHHGEFLSVFSEEVTQPRRGVLLQSTWAF
jgi:outer membrane cobalamin receptor